VNAGTEWVCVGRIEEVMSPDYRRQLMDDELIEGQVAAVRVACRRMSGQRLEALRLSV
jgi:hypothetical protein